MNRDPTRKVGDKIQVFLIMGVDGLLHASGQEVRAGQVFFAACGYPRAAARTPRISRDGKVIDERLCPHCIVQPPESS